MGKQGDDSDQFGETERAKAPPCIRVGVATSVGGRATMEDAHVVIPDVSGLYKREFGDKKLLSFFGVCLSCICSRSLGTGAPICQA